MSQNGDRLGAGTVTDPQRLEVQDGPMSNLRGCPEPLPALARLVRREALFERLSAIRPGGVGLVSGPAGSGKTVLLRSRAENAREPVAWVTVDRGEEPRSTSGSSWRTPSPEQQGAWSSPTRSRRTPASADLP
jgi:MoxR-like ATPase